MPVTEGLQAIGIVLVVWLVLFAIPPHEDAHDRFQDWKWRTLSRWFR